MTRIVRGLVLCLVAVSGVASRALAGESISMRLPSGKELHTELMVTDEERARGLMFRDALPRDHALLFVFEDSFFHAFWMKNCRFPIDIVWLDSERRVVHVAEDVPPCKRDPCPNYQPLRRALYVVELNAGQAEREQVRVGAVIEFTLPR
jgi:uncharacterized membrane protein (UPF0127 family)